MSRHPPHDRGDVVASTTPARAGPGAAAARCRDEAEEHVRVVGALPHVTDDLRNGVLPGVNRVDLPDVGGVEVSEQLKADAACSHVPVVIYSASDKRDCPQGAVAFVGKTSDPDVLLAAVEKHCRKD